MYLWPLLILHNFTFFIVFNLNILVQLQNLQSTDENAILFKENNKANSIQNLYIIFLTKQIAFKIFIKFSFDETRTTRIKTM